MTDERMACDKETEAEHRQILKGYYGEEDQTRGQRGVTEGLSVLSLAVYTHHHGVVDNGTQEVEGQTA